MVLAFVTVAMLLVSLACVFVWGRNIGVAEDWLMVPFMTGNQDHVLSWLWSQNNEHRLPVQRLLYGTLLFLTQDFRVGMIASQLFLAASAVLLMRAAYLLRNRKSHWSDVIYPLALLNLGHWENLVWGWQIQFVWSVFLSLSLLFVIATTPATLDRRGTIACSLLLVLLPVSGQTG
jgi:hypothetical protein